jgi:GNAT superfamily N-acetyltransferase
MYSEGDEQGWAELKVLVEEFYTKEDALKYFDEEFNKEELPSRMVLLMYDGKIVGTSTAWYGELDGKKMERIHWVSVHPEHQQKGLSKSLFEKSLNLFTEKESYLTSQTWSYKALNLYSKYGYLPYKDSDDFQEAWEYINYYIKEYKKNKEENE